MEILKVSIKNLLGLDQLTVFFNKNTIVMGGNNSGKTRFLNILFSALKGTLKKDFKNKTSNDSKISISFINDENESLRSIYEGINLELQNNDDKDIVNYANFPLYIESHNIDLNAHITNIIQNEISETEEFTNFKNKVEEIAEEKYGLLNETTLISDQRPAITNEAQDKLPKYKVELFNENVPISKEGDGMKKAMIIKLLKDSNTNIVLIDELENHLSVHSIQEIISSFGNSVQLIATSHRIEVSQNIGAVTSLNNKTIDNIGAYINASICHDVIVVEGSFDIPIIKKYLKIKGINNKVIVVGTSKEEAKKISKKYQVKTVIDLDNDGPINCNWIYQINKRQMENYVPQDFIDNDDNLRGIIQADHKTINEMVQESEGFDNNQNLKRYIASKAEQWLTNENPLINELDNFLLREI